MALLCMPHVRIRVIQQLNEEGKANAHMVSLSIIGKKPLEKSYHKYANMFSFFCGIAINMNYI